MNTKGETLILVIDDDDLVRQAIVVVLEHYGFTNILQASRGEEGIRMIENHHPKLVFTDLTMPGMRGEEVIRWIALRHRPKFPTIKVIAVSGDDQRKLEPVVMAAGGNGFLHKPFNLDDLQRLVQAQLVEA